MNYSSLRHTSIFECCAKAEIESIENAIGLPVKRYKKDEIILHAGECVENICIVLSGSVRIDSNDIRGNRSILKIVKRGEVFAEAYACIPDVPLMVDAVANEPCEIVFLNVAKLFSLPESETKNKLLKNLVAISSKKNLHLSARILHTASKTIRGRVLSYLSQEATKQNSRFITIPFNRQQMADYLSVERSALSKELGKMKADGLIDYHKSTFKLTL
ncbi:MAG: Crp/Fnr family transcriptional regulator [Clostridia bacterium]|nr:Crp/Fnr family transcriptional regulator [Clostridia bacterium]